MKSPAFIVYFARGTLGRLELLTVKNNNIILYKPICTIIDTTTKEANIIDDNVNLRESRVPTELP